MKTKTNFPKKYLIRSLAGKIYATARAKRRRLPHVQNLYGFLNVAYHFKN